MHYARDSISRTTWHKEQVDFIDRYLSVMSCLGLKTFRFGRIKYSSTPTAQDGIVGKKYLFLEFYDKNK